MTAPIEIAIVVCMARNRVIGRDGQMPWRMPSDLKHFKALTLGRPVVMGRKTYASIGKALPGRPNIVVSRQAGLKLPDATVVTDLDAGIREATHIAQVAGTGAIFVIGGGEIYRQALEVADTVHVTVLAADIDGDTRFPELPEATWELASRTPLDRTARDDHDAEIRVYRRRRDAS